MADDDIQLQVGIDLEALKASAERAADVIGRSLQGAMASSLGGLTLGSGLPATAVPGGGDGGDILKTLEQILSTLELGFSRLGDAIQQQRTSTIEQARQQREKVDGMGPVEGAVNVLRKKTQDISSNQNLGYLSSVGHTAGTLSQGLARALHLGGEAEWARFGESVAGMIPGMGGWASAFGAIAADAEKEDALRTLRYQAWRDMGIMGANWFYDSWSTDTSSGGGLMASWEKSDWYRYGFGPSESLDWLRRGVRATGNISTGLYLAGAQAYLGLGEEATGLAGAVRRGGVVDGEAEALGEAIGVAIATNLERGRWGESVQAMTRAAQSVMHSQVDIQRIVAMQTFIGRMGAQYQGDTASARSMEEALKGLGGGTAGGVSQVMALRAAGLGQPGVSYAEALMRTQRGVFAIGGTDPAEVLKQYINFKPVKRAITSGDKEEIDQAAMYLQQLVPSVDMPTWASILNAVHHGIGPGRGIDDEKLREIINAFSTAPLPDINLKPTRKKIKEQHPASLGWRDYQSAPPGVDDLKTAKTYRTPEEAAAAKAAMAAADAAITAAGMKQQQFSYKRPAAIDPDKWSHYGDEIQRGATTMQREAVKHERAYEPTYEWERFVGSEGEAEAQWAVKPGHGLYDVRDTDPSGKPLAKGKHRIHGSRDIYMPPGSPVYTPVAGYWRRSFDASGQGSTYGFGGELEGEDGLLYRFIHLAERPTLKKGTYYPAGQLIGYTVKHNVGKSRSHLHLEAWDVPEGEKDFRKGTMRDPFRTKSGEFDLEKVNYLYGGSASYEEYAKKQRAKAPDEPVTSPDAEGEASPVTAPEGNAVPVSKPSADAASAGPVSRAVSTQQVEITIAVRDDRVSIQKVAGAGKKVGPRRVRVG